MKRVWGLLLVVVSVALVLASGVDLRNSAARSHWSKQRATGVRYPYAGQLQDAGGGPAANGAYDFTFALYAAGSGGSPLWFEAQAGVPVQGGAFVALVGRR